MGSKAQRFGGMKWRVPGWALAVGGMVRSMMVVFAGAVSCVMRVYSNGYAIPAMELEPRDEVDGTLHGWQAR